MKYLIPTLLTGCFLCFTTLLVLYSPINLFEYNALNAIGTMVNSERIETKIAYSYLKLLNESLLPSNRRITLLVNSCNRLDLLNRTLASFWYYYPHSKYPLYEKILIDDCRDINGIHELINLFYKKYKFEIVLTNNNEYENKYNFKKASVRDKFITNAMDKIHRQVVTPWIYHLEDDWIFTRYGFIEDSFNVFEASLNQKINTNLNLYSMVICRFYPNRDHGPYSNKKFVFKNTSFGIVEHRTSEEWGGFTFNPGLYTKYIYDLYSPFTSPQGPGSEVQISHKMRKDGFRVAQLNGNPVACGHIGYGHTVKNLVERVKDDNHSSVQ